VVDIPIAYHSQPRPQTSIGFGITTISKVRLRERLGKLGAEDMQEVARIIRLQLGFD
jgi:mRNA-degrading endonuclease toxin of MazEF toxin-antitoxin module